MIFDAIWVMTMIVNMIIIKFHGLFRYLIRIFFVGDFIINLPILIHIVMIMVVKFIPFKFDHFCFELGMSEIIYRNKIIKPPI